MKKIIVSFLCLGLLIAENLDVEIENLKNEIKSYGMEPKIPFKKPENKKHSKNGLFIGVMGAIGSVQNSYEDGKYNAINSVQGAHNTGVLQSFSDSSLLFMFGGKIGYQNFFIPYFGTRIYGDLLAGGGRTYRGGKLIGTTQYALGGLNLDLMGEYKIKEGYEIGGFVGFGFGVMLLSDKLSSPQSVLLRAASTIFDDGSGAMPIGSAQSKGNILWKNLLQVDYTFNVGVSFALFNRHRFELGVKIPVTYLKLGLESPATYRVSTNKGDKEVSLKSGDLSFKRTSYVTLSYIYLF